MPNAKTHIKVGAVVGLFSGAILNFIDQHRRMEQGLASAFDWQEFLEHCALGLGTGAIGGILPDVLEPAYHPNHRNICHSVMALAGVGYSGVKTANHHNIDPYLKTILISGCAAYASHILLDGETPNGVPLIA